MELGELHEFIDELLVNYRSAIRFIDDYTFGCVSRERAEVLLKTHLAWVGKWKKEESQ